MKHLRRPLVNPTHCDPDDDREMTDDMADVDCQECIDAYEKRTYDWHADLAVQKRLRTGEVPKIDTSEDDTQPGKRKR